MEDNHLKSFEVSGFKKFDNLKLEDLGQFNLIIGDNNVGKTSLLEALLVDKNTSNFIYGLGSIIFNVKHFGELSNSFLNLYFSSKKDSYPKSFECNMNFKNNTFNSFKLMAADEYKFWINNNQTENKLSDDANIRNDAYRNPYFAINIPFIPMGNFYSTELTTQFSKNIQDDSAKKEEFILALKNLIPNIKYIELSLKYSNIPTLVITEFEKNGSFPLASYGEGLVKLFRILLSIFSIKNFGRIMIDELDAGIHHSNMKTFITSLLQISRSEKKQIFATTHSKECIENFAKALEETDMQDEGRIIHLADTKNGIKAFTMRYAEFENSIMAESEIR